MRTTQQLAGLLAVVGMAGAANAIQGAQVDGAPPSATPSGTNGNYTALFPLVRGPVDVSTANGISHGGLAAGTTVAARGIERARDTGRIAPLTPSKEWWYVAANTPGPRLDKWDPNPGNIAPAAAPAWASELLLTGIVTAGGFGLRDGAANRDVNSGSSTKMWWGEDAGKLYEFDISATGDLTVCQLYIINTPAGANAGTIRALARDPATGIFYTANFGGPVYSFVLPAPGACAGGGMGLPSIPVIATAASANPGKAFYGFGWKTLANNPGGTLWGWSQDGGPPNCQATEYTIVAGAPPVLAGTGLGFQGLGGSAFTGIAGGADIDVDETNGNNLNLIALVQISPTFEIEVYDLKTMANQSTYCTSKVNSQNFISNISGTGTPSATLSGGYSVTSAPALLNKPGLILYSISGRAATPFFGGTLCVAGAPRRTTPSNSGPGGVYSLDMNTFAQGGLGGPPFPIAALKRPGQQVNCQWWGRDPMHPDGTGVSLSDALEYTIGP